MKTARSANPTSRGILQVKYLADGTLVRVLQDSAGLNWFAGDPARYHVEGISLFA